MAFAQAANVVDMALPHEQKPITQNIANYEDTGDSTHTMKALTWQGKYNVKLSWYPLIAISNCYVHICTI
jgi:hypothetical protein